MELFELLKKLNNIKPDPEYVEKSKRVIFSAPQLMPESNTWGRVMIGIRIGAVTSLAAIAIIFVSGLFGGKPSSVSALDPVAIRAEAQAIDIQIELTKFGYDNPTTTLKMIVGQITSGKSDSPSKVGENQTDESTSTGEVSINQALELLTEENE